MILPLRELLDFPYRIDADDHSLGSAVNTKVEEAVSVQTNTSIKKMIDDDEIIMRPMRPAQINNGSVDVTLGRFAWRLKDKFRSDFDPSKPLIGQLCICPTSMVGHDIFDLVDIQRDHGGRIWFGPGERMIMHTHEFIGSRYRSLPEMRAKSSSMRWGFTLSGDAGWGDVGFFSRWATEPVNFNPCPMVLEVGQLVGQVIFHAVDTPEAGTLYHEKGNYQNESNIEEIIKNWHPRDLLPKKMKTVPFEAMNDVDRFGV